MNTLFRGMFVLLLGGILSTGLFAGGQPEQASEEGSDPERLERLVLQGPPVLPLSLPMLRVVESGALDAYADEVEYMTWKNPDEMRARISAGQAQISAVPSNVGANLYNRGFDVKLVNVAVWGILYLLGPDESAIEWEALRDETVYSPFRGDMPDLVFRYLARQNDLEPGEDFSLEYVSVPSELVRQVAVGDVEYAVLPEQAASAALMRSAQTERPMQRVMDLQEEWGATTGSAPRIPQAGILVPGSFVEQRPELVATLHRAMISAVQWMTENPEQAGGPANEYLNVPPQLVQQALPFFNVGVEASAAVRGELEGFYERLIELSPQLVGGGLPDDGFYYAGRDDE